MRAGHRSFTSELVSAVRAMYTQGPPEYAVVDDPAAFELLPAPWLWLLGAANAIPGGNALIERAARAASLGLTDGVAMRTALIDDELRAAVPARVARTSPAGAGVRADGGARPTTQVVLLGAGMDGRAWRLPELAGVRVFEVDHPDTQAWKRERIRLPALCREVVFVPVDFERDVLDTELERAGHSRAEPTFWIWEGVTMYLTPAAVRGTLDVASRRSASGSVMAMTYLPPEHGHRWARPLGAALARVVGESLHATFTTAEAVDLLAAAGFSELSVDGGAVELGYRYWPAARAERLVTWERTAIARKP